VTQSIAIETRTNLNATATVPGSKSCTARALVMAGLTEGVSRLLEPADCDDSDYMIGGLRDLGLAVEKRASEITVQGGAFQPPTKPLFLGNSGTAMRFLAAACATMHGEVTLDGVSRMRQRPIVDLVEALSDWGVSAEAPTGCPPITVRSDGQFGGTATVKGDASSQYLTGLLLTAPRATRDVVVRIDGELVSKPYIDLTLAMMTERGVEATHDNYTAFHVRAGQRYCPGTFAIEADASGASYFLAAAAVAGGKVRVLNLSTRSLQGDARFAYVLERMGCRVSEGENWVEVSSDGHLQGIDVDLNAMPDMAQTLAVVAAFAEGPTHIRNVANLRIKETDRIRATATELRKLGARVDEHDDGLDVYPGPLHGAAIDTYDDHRMAMSFAVAGLVVPGVVINEPGCVSKTFPDFFERFGALR
jgi:3-phosphoshikimate 1-carboxyvinyltransferase